MSHTPGLTGDEGHEAKHNTADALLAVASPPLVPNDDVFADDYDEALAEEAASPAPEREFPKANWLDALPSEALEQHITDPGRISSVNSDDNGLYRMFIGVSP